MPRRAETEALLRDERECHHDGMPLALRRAMDVKHILSRARLLFLLFPLHGLLTAGGVGCGSVTANHLSTSSSIYGAYGHFGNGHSGYYGYYGCTDGYGYEDPVYGTGCDDGRTDYGYGFNYGYTP